MAKPVSTKTVSKQFDYSNINLFEAFSQEVQEEIVVLQQSEAEGRIWYLDV